MVELVLDRTCEKPARGHDLRHVVLVEILACHLGGALHRAADAGEAQAPFLVELAALPRDYLGIEENKRHRDDGIERLVRFCFAAFGNVDHAHPLGVADLLRRESDALRGVHRGNHIDRKSAKRPGHNRDRHRLLAKDRFSVLVYLELHRQL